MSATPNKQTIAGQIILRQRLDDVIRASNDLVLTYLAVEGAVPQDIVEADYRFNSWKDAWTGKVSK